MVGPLYELFFVSLFPIRFQFSNTCTNILYPSLIFSGSFLMRMTMWYTLDIKVIKVKKKIIWHLKPISIWKKLFFKLINLTMLFLQSNNFLLNMISSNRIKNPWRKTNVLTNILLKSILNVLISFSIHLPVHCHRNENTGCTCFR